MAYWYFLKVIVLNLYQNVAERDHIDIALCIWTDRCQQWKMKWNTIKTNTLFANLRPRGLYRAKATRPKICKKSVCFYCITTSLWRTPVNHLKWNRQETNVYKNMQPLKATLKFANFQKPTMSYWIIYIYIDRSFVILIPHYATWSQPGHIMAMINS